MSATRFERATAVEPAGDGSWEAWTTRDWWTPRGPNGGYLAAIVLRAMARELDDPGRPARSVTLHFLRPPQPGAVRIDVSVERAGRTLSTLSARLIQDGRPCVLAIGAFAGAFPSAGTFTAPMPDVPAATTIEPWPAHPTMPPVAHRLRMRPAVGALPFSGAEEALTGGWMSLEEPQRLDAPALAFFADAWLPAAFPRFTEPVLAPTIDLTIHFRDPAAALAEPPDEPVLGVFRSDFAVDGMVEEDGHLWSAGGVLLAQSRQLALLVPAEPRP
jgi:acyl-CoA thioesterase